MVRHAFPQFQVSDEGADVTERLFGLVCRSTPEEAQSLCATLPEGERARLALFCNARAHVRAVGRAIASTCSKAALVREGGYAGLVLYDQIESGPEKWGLVTRAASKPISLSHPAMSAQARRPLESLEEF